MDIIANLDTAGMLPAGTVLRDTYRIDSYLASGGFGNTYVVTHLELGSRLVVKEFFMRGISEREADGLAVSVPTTRSRATFDSQLLKFVKEARRLWQLRGDHIVHIHDLFRENGTAYYVMDLIDGCSLKAYVEAHGAMSEGKVREILSQLLDALEAIHSQHLQHLDLKPANILIDKGGRVTLIDFGASKQVDPSSDGVTSSVIAYTKGYAPHEQIAQDLDKIGPWSDFYALGATLYNLLTRRMPPLASAIVEEGTAAFLFPDSVSSEMRSLILWMMDFNRKARPQSVADIRQWLLAATESQPEDEATVITAGETVPRPMAQAQPKHQPRTQAGVETAALYGAGEATSKPQGGKLSWGALLVAGLIVAGLPAVFMMRRCTQDGGDADSVAHTFPATASPDPLGLCPDTNHPHAIDMGTGVKFACCNVGASTPADYGDYFAWGETSPKSTYYWSTYKWCNGSEDTMTKYCTSSSYGTVDNLTQLELTDDAARAVMGGTWRMPTIAELDALRSTCTWTWTSKGGHNGCLVTASNGNKLFLPAAGCRIETSLYYGGGSRGSYWSSTLYTSSSNHGQSLYFNSGSHGTDIYYRFYGRSVRAVTE